MPSPQEVAAQIERNAARLTDHMADELEERADDVRDIEYGVTHKKSGDLRDSLTRFGPFETGNAVEARIVPVDIPYAEIEASRGTDHNFAEQGLKASDAVIENLRRSLERLGVRSVEGRL